MKMKAIGTMILTFLYVASPLDFIPDFLIGIGQVDDLGALVIGIRTACQQWNSLPNG